AGGRRPRATSSSKPLRQGHPSAPTSTNPRNKSSRATARLAGRTRYHEPPLLPPPPEEDRDEVRTELELERRTGTAARNAATNARRLLPLDRSTRGAAPPAYQGGGSSRPASAS